MDGNRSSDKNSSQEISDSSIMDDNSKEKHDILQQVEKIKHQ